MCCDSVSQTRHWARSGRGTRQSTEHDSVCGEHRCQEKLRETLLVLGPSTQFTSSHQAAPPTCCVTLNSDLTSLSLLGLWKDAPRHSIHRVAGAEGGQARGHCSVQVCPTCWKILREVQSMWQMPRGLETSEFKALHLSPFLTLRVQRERMLLVWSSE